MPRALEVVTGFTTAPSTTFTALTMAAGNSATVRNATPGTGVHLIQAWGDRQTAGTFRARSPRLHDNVQGIRLDVAASDVKPLLPWGYTQRLVPQDALILENTGSGTAGDIETDSILVYYEDLPGSDARLATHSEVGPRVENLVTIENTLATGTAGGYSGEEALNAEFNLLKANTEYALLGYLVDAECATVRWRGSDLGNYGVGGPGDELGRDFTADWFVRLSRLYNLPTIPIINSANLDAVLIDAAQDENGTDVTVTSILAELR